MVKLHLVGFSSDLKSLVFSTRRGAKSGTYMVDVNPRLKRTLEEIASRQAESEAEEVVEQPKPVARDRRPPPRFDRPPAPPSKLSPKEIQALLREGKTPDEVARLAECDVSWIERFLSPILAERAVVIGIVKSARITRLRRGLSSMPVGEAIQTNLESKKVRLSPEAFDDGWSAVRREGQWEVTFTYSSRGRATDLAFVVDHERNVRTANPQAAALGWRPKPGDEEADEVPDAPAARAGGARAEGAAGTKPEPAPAQPADKAAPTPPAAKEPAPPAPRRGWSLPSRRTAAEPPAPEPKRGPRTRAARGAGDAAGAPGPAGKPGVRSGGRSAGETARAVPAKGPSAAKTVPAKGPSVAKAVPAKPDRGKPATKASTARAKAAPAPKASSAATRPSATRAPSTSKGSTRRASSTGTTAAAGRAPSTAKPAPKARASGGTAGAGSASRSRTSAAAPPASKPISAPPPVRGAAARRREPAPPLRPGQAVSLADVGWSLPADRVTPRPPSGRGPSGR